MKFELSETEEKLANEFRKHHGIYKCKRRKFNWLKRLLLKYLGIKYNNGISCYYEFYPTGIGAGVNIVCDNCGERKDLTDYNSW